MELRPLRNHQHQKVSKDFIELVKMQKKSSITKNEQAENKIKLNTVEMSLNIGRTKVATNTRITDLSLNDDLYR